MNSISNSPSGITRISIKPSETSQHFTNLPSELYKSKIYLKNETEKLDSMLSSNRLSKNLTRDDSVLVSSENTRIKIERISQELDLAKPVLQQNFPIPKRPHLEKSKLIVVNLTPKPVIMNKITELIHESKQNIEEDEDLVEEKQNFKLDKENKIVKNYLNDSQEKLNSNDALKVNQNKLNTSASRVDEDNQTPVSTSYKSKHLNDNSRLTEPAVQPQPPQKQISNSNMNQLNAKLSKSDLNSNLNQLNIKSSKSDLNSNEILNTKASSYYNDVMMQKEIEQSTHQPNINLVKQENKIENKPDYKQQEEVVLEIVNENKMEPIEKVESQENNFTTNSKRLATFYNGNRIWTIGLEMHESQENLIDKHNHEELEQEEHEYDQEPGNGEFRKTKKNLKVKIITPDSNSYDLKEKRSQLKKERNLQRCCYLLFLLILFFLSIGILIYFFVWNFLNDKIQES